MVENNENMKSVKFQGDTLNFSDFIQVLSSPELELKIEKCDYIFSSPEPKAPGELIGW